MKFSYDGCTLRVEDGLGARLERFDVWKIKGIGCSFVMRQFCIAIKDPVCFELEHGSDAMRCIRDFQEEIEYILGYSDIYFFGDRIETLQDLIEIVEDKYVG